MKKLFLGAAIAMSSLTFAQQFGIKAGMNVSSINSEGDFNDSKSKIGFNAGVFMNAPIAKDFSIQPEVLYNRVGTKIASVGDKDINFNLDYISVPVMFQYNATPEFYLEAGPQFGFLTSAKVKKETQDYKDYMNNFDFGLGLGAGYYFTPNVGLTARYVAGFSDISKNGEFGGDAKNRNNVFQVGMAYKF